jgi:hypothetical protein
MERLFRNGKRAGSAGLLLLCLSILVGCQGFSSSKAASQPPAASGSLVLSSTTLNFGTVTASTNKTLTVTATNNGAASVTLSSAAISTQYFSFSGPSLPLTIAVGQNATLSFVFSPNIAGTYNATVSIASDAANSPATLALSGTAVSDGLLDLNPTSESFGSVTVGTQSNQTVTLTNNSASTVNISQIAATGSGFKVSGMSTPVALNVSQSATFTVTFGPTSTGAASGSVTITSDAPNPTLTMTLAGVGASVGALSANPASLSFGTVHVGSSEPLSETITNTGGSTVTISKVAISGTGFALSGISAPVNLAAGQSANFTVTYSPQSAGSGSGSVTVTSNGSNPTLSIALTGTATVTAGQLTATPATLAVGNVAVGASGTASGNLNASGANVTVTAASTNNSRFTISGLSLPAVITAGQSLPFTLTFSPQVTGADSATLTFVSNAQPSSTTAGATGTGTPAPTHTVNLSWSASSSPDISGYNIYRAIYTNACGGYSKINGSKLDTLTTYTDSVVADGTNYCYATTAVNSSNEESGYSNVVSDVQIPPP